MPEEITDAIEDLAQNPANITVGNQSVGERSLTELIEADKYLQQKQVAQNSGGKAHFGLRFSQIVPPGGG